MLERLIHYSREPLVAIRDAEQTTKGRGDKPNGLWVSIGDGEDGWRQWCADENFPCGPVATEIVLSSGANVLRLSSADEIDLFTAEHKDQPEWSSGVHLFKGAYCIDWPTVARQFDGIIVAPYCWERRLHMGTHWYYGWDCASGCIWRASAVADLRSFASASEFA